MITIKVSEKGGELSFGIFWISLDGRLQAKWYRTYNEAKNQYFHLKYLKRKPSFNIRIEEDDIDGKD